jgi:hypothetical protein
MKKISNLFQNKRSIVGLFLLAALVSTTYKIQENSGRIKRLTNFESGMQTCFTRVNQTYTAKMLAEATSEYLTQNFQNLTEECFAEGILNVEESFKNELSQTTKKLSNLASNVHWFHEDILSPGTSKSIAGDGESRDVGARFEKIESTKDEILDSSELYKTEIFEALNKQKTFFYVSSIFLVILMFSEYMSTTRRRLSNNSREKEAEAELLDNGGVSSVKVGEIIRSALEQNDLINCSKLFSNFHTLQSFDKNLKNKNIYSVLGDLVTPQSAYVHTVMENEISDEVNELVNKMWNDEKTGITNDNSEGKMLHDLNLETMSSSVIDLLVEKLFSQGIQIDIKIPENLMIKGRNEELEQSLYHLLNFAINSTHTESGEKSISLCAQKLGDVVAFDLTYRGQGFDNEMLKYRVGLSNVQTQQDIDLQICQTLLQEIDAKLQLDNKMNQQGEIVGGRVKIIFKTGAMESSESKMSKEARLIDLKRGSKKEIMASLNSSANSAMNI